MSLTVTATERRILRTLMQVAGEQHLPLTVPQVQLLARYAARAADSGRPAELSPSGRPVRSSPENPAALLSAALNPAPGSRAPSAPSSASQRAAERLHDDPDAVQILKLLANHLTNADIAEHMDLTPNRVKYVLSCWYTVTGSVSRTGLAAWARAEGIVPSRGKR